MKGPIVMMIDAFLRLAGSSDAPAGDVVLCLMPDEEAGSDIGAKYLVSNHPEIFDGVEHAIGEFGGFSYYLDGVEFMPIQVSERIGVEFTVTLRGPGGHGSIPIENGAMARLGRILTALDTHSLPVHIAPATRLMLEGIARHTAGTTAFGVKRLFDDRTAALTVKLFGSQFERIGPLLRNTVSATVVRGGDSTNVIPSVISLTLDGRMVPNSTPERFLAELRAVIGEDCEISYETEWVGPPPDLDLSMYPLLKNILTGMRPGVVPLPYMQSGVTDGRVFAALGIQTYGFTPMPLTRGLLVREDRPRIGRTDPGRCPRFRSASHLRAPPALRAVRSDESRAPHRTAYSSSGLRSAGRDGYVGSPSTSDLPPDQGACGALIRSARA